MKSFKEYIIERAITLEYHNELNPALWTNDQLQDDVRGKLLAIGKEWAITAFIPENIIKDMVITGGNVNYNYTPYSDIDLHLIVDKSQIGLDATMIDDYLNDKKTLWTLKHNIKVRNYPVELYAANYGEAFPMGQGVYSIMNNKWVQVPKNENLDFANDTLLQKKADYYEDLVNGMIHDNKPVHDFETITNKLYTMRAAAIHTAGEFSFENLLFKELRNRGIIDKIKSYKNAKYDAEYSL